jgi:hypothetical protein
MKWIGGNVKQTAADTKTQVEIPTSLGVVDQKTIWEIYGMDIYWQSIGGMNAVNGGISVTATLTAIAGDTLFGDVSEIMRWSVQRILASAGVSPVIQKSTIDVEPIYHLELIVPYQYANSKLYLTLSSAATAFAQEIRYKLYYEEKKVSEVDFYKLQSLGCIC